MSTKNNSYESSNLCDVLPDTLRSCRALKVLDRSLSQGRLAHGILLHGENLLTLENIVRVITAKLLKSKGDPFEHPDCFILRPSGKAQLIKVGKSDESNSMRKLIVDIAKSSNQGGYKVGILLDADRMNPASANAFLKTLEEPPNGTTLFLLSTRPYDILSTIRSRCMNFRIPCNVECKEDPRWGKWLVDYREWLGLLLNGVNKRNIPHIILGAYGLNARFHNILKEMTKRDWESQKKNLSENVSAEQKDAMESGISKGFRKELFGQIENATAQFARDVESLNSGQLPIIAIHQATDKLEKSVGLMEINFSQVAALELIFLSSLRIWSRQK